MRVEALIRGALIGWPLIKTPVSADPSPENAFAVIVPDDKMLLILMSPSLDSSDLPI